MDDRRDQAGFTQFMQKRAVEHHARRGLEAEADVAQADDGVTVRQFAADAARAFDRLHRIAAVLLYSRADGQHERIEK